MFDVDHELMHGPSQVKHPVSYIARRCLVVTARVQLLPDTSNGEQIMLM